MPEPVLGREAVDLGNGLAATVYDDGSAVFWSIATGEQVASAPPGSQAVDLGTGQAATLGPQGALDVWGIGSGQGTFSLPGFQAPAGNGALDFGRSSLTIDPDYLPYLSNPRVAPGYLPGSGTYNQFRLDQPWLFGTEFGQPVNYQYGSGGPGDPTTGREAQTQGQQQWMQGGRLFTYPGANLEDRYSPLGNLLLRSDTDSGLGSPDVPDWVGPLAVEAIQQGRFRPTQRGAQWLQQRFGITPQQYGGSVAGDLPGAQSGQINLGGYTGAGAAGAPGGAPGQIGAGFAAGSYQDPDLLNAITNAAQVAYQRTYSEWLQRHGDETLALQRAQQAAAEAQTQAQNALAAAGLMASLRGPANQFAAANAAYGLNRRGIPNAVAALSGEYSPPAFQAPQAAPQAASLGTVAQQIAGAGTAGAGAGAGAGVPSGWTTMGPEGLREGAGTPDIYRQAQQWAAALPAANQIVGRNFLRLSPATQQLNLAGYEFRGENPEDVLNTIQRGLPQFSAPQYGAIS